MQFNLKSTSGSQKPNHPPIEFLPPAPRKNHLPKFSTQIRKLPIRRFRGSTTTLSRKMVARFSAKKQNPIGGEIPIKHESDLRGIETVHFSK